MKIVLVFICPLLLLAKIHYAKVEPFESIMVKSAVSALVVGVNIDAEGKMLNEEEIIHLDDTLDKFKLQSTHKSLQLLSEMQSINEEILQALADTLQRQEDYYKRMSKLSTASKTQKDNAYSAFVTAKTQYLGTKEKISNIKKQIVDTEYTMKQLEDSIAKKTLVLKEKYLYKLFVKKGDYVAPGSVLAQVMDVNRAKLVLFLDGNELEGLESKSLYLNGNKTNYKVNKVWKVADEKFISSYRTEIYIDAPKESFSKLVKIEIK